VQGSIPDMTALTATYLELQRLYRDKAEQDLAALEAHVRQVHGDGPPPPTPPPLSDRYTAVSRPGYTEIVCASWRVDGEPLGK